MRTVAFIAILFALAAPLAAQRIDAVPHALPVDELPRATLDELARAVVTPRLGGGHDERPRPVQSLAATRAGGAPVVAEFVTAPNVAATPVVVRGFRSSFDPLPGAAFYYYPPDASGAAGPNHVVGVFNNSVAVHDRNGNQLAFLTIDQFWANGPQHGSALFDPRVMYDGANDRWVIAMLTDNNEVNGALLLAVSATGDPAGAWRRFRISISQNPAVALDFTRMAMTADQIVITADEWENVSIPNGTDIFTIPKSIAYSATATPVATKTLSTFSTDLTPVSSADNTVRILSNNTEPLVQHELAFGQLVETASYSPPIPFYYGVGDCDQLGTTKTVDCGGLMLHYAIFRDGVLWVVQKGSRARSVIVVWKIAGNGAKVFVIEDAATDYGFPSIAVNRLGAALVGYSTFSASMYPSAACRYIDPAGNVSAPAVVKGGEDWYTNWRWGDYSTTVVDPADDTNFWTLQSYARPPVGIGHISWGTWWAYVQAGRPPRVRAVRHP